MKDFRSSQDINEREIYACMVQNLFDEWKFFPKYPKRELNMTARLFGKIISEKKIIDGVVTDIGLKCIVEGLKREGKMFDFAITALEECKDSIDSETGLKNILTCKTLQIKKPELYDYINKRYKELHCPQEEPPQPKMEPPVFQPTPVPNPVVVPNQQRRPQDREIRTFIPNRQPPKTQNPLSNTPTQPEKYFEGQMPPDWSNTPQFNAARMMYPTNQQRSARQFDSLSLGGSAMDAGPRALNIFSESFKPKTQQIVENLKKEEMFNMPQDFIDELTRVLNSTGTLETRKKALAFEEEHIKDEFIPKIAHIVIMKRVLDTESSRIEFFANFFHAMKNRSIVQAFITE